MVCVVRIGVGLAEKVASQVVERLKFSPHRSYTGDPNSGNIGAEFPA